MRTRIKQRLETLEQAREILLEMIDCDKVSGRVEKKILAHHVTRMTHALETATIKLGLCDWADGRLTIHSSDPPLRIYMDTNFKQPKDHVDWMIKQIQKMPKVSVEELRAAFPNWRVTFS